MYNTRHQHSYDICCNYNKGVAVVAVNIGLPIAILQRNPIQYKMAAT